MFIILTEHKLLTGITLLFFLLGILCQIIAGILYQTMIAETDNMSGTKNKLLQQCKQKYANYYKLNGKMVNTEAFVDKFMHKIRIAKISLCRLPQIGGQLMMLSVLVVGISVCRALAGGSSFFQIIPYYLISILGLYFYFSVSGLIDIQEKKNVLRTNLTDYLENHLIPRLEVEKENALEEGIKKREKYAKELWKEDAWESTVQKETAVEEKEISRLSETRKENAAEKNTLQFQDELEHLLEEFFA